MKKALLILVAAIVLLIAWWCYDYRRMMIGYELPLREGGARLATLLDETFGWSDLPSDSLERVWTNGFQDHPTLYRVRLSREKFGELRNAVLAKTGESIRINDDDNLALCPLDFGTDSPQGPGKIPKWWNARSLKRFDGILWVLPGRLHGHYWFGYDADQQILFLFHLNS